jgi:hypothetical protein
MSPTSPGLHPAGNRAGSQGCSFAPDSGRLPPSGAGRHYKRARNRRRGRCWRRSGITRRPNIRPTLPTPSFARPHIRGRRGQADFAAVGMATSLPPPIHVLAPIEPCRRFPAALRPRGDFAAIEPEALTLAHWGAAALGRASPRHRLGHCVVARVSPAPAGAEGDGLLRCAAGRLKLLRPRLNSRLGAHSSLTAAAGLRQGNTKRSAALPTASP